MLIPSAIGMITGIVAIVWLAMSWADLMADVKTQGAARYVIGVLLILSGGAVLLLLVPSLAGEDTAGRTWQQQRGFGVIIIAGIALALAGFRLLRR